MNWRRALTGTTTRCGCQRVRSTVRSTVSGVARTNTASAASTRPTTTYGNTKGAGAYCASTPAIRGPNPMPPGSTAIGVRVGPKVQLGEVRGGGRRGQTDREARDHARDQKSGEARRDDEEECTRDVDEEPRRQNPTTPEPVRDVSYEKQAHDDASGVDREHDRNHERRKVVALLVQGVEGRGDGRCRHRHEERQRHDPVAGPRLQSLAPRSTSCSVLSPGRVRPIGGDQTPGVRILRNPRDILISNAHVDTSTQFRE